jgi:hypothetical protein
VRSRGASFDDLLDPADGEGVEEERREHGGHPLKSGVLAEGKGESEADGKRREDERRDSERAHPT